MRLKWVTCLAQPVEHSDWLVDGGCGHPSSFLPEELQLLSPAWAGGVLGSGRQRAGALWSP